MTAPSAPAAARLGDDRAALVAARTAQPDAEFCTLVDAVCAHDADRILDICECVTARPAGHDFPGTIGAFGEDHRAAVIAQLTIPQF